MSPEAVCPECGRKQMFHEDELDDVRRGRARCVECALQHQYYVFFGEVLDGKHKDAMAKFKKQLEDEASARGSED